MKIPNILEVLTDHAYFGKVSILVLLVELILNVLIIDNRQTQLYKRTLIRTNINSRHDNINGSKLTPDRRVSTAKQLLHVLGAPPADNGGLFLLEQHTQPHLLVRLNVQNLA